MSKRDDGAALGFYEDAGYLPAAVRNYLCLLGWSPGANEEVLDIHEIVKRFELKDLNRSNARFDAAKLFWINGEYWRAMPDSEFSEFAKTYLAKHRPTAASLPDALRVGLLRVIREKIRTGKELAEWMDPYLTEDYSYSPEARKKQFSNPDAGKLLLALEQGFAALDVDLSDAAAEAICKKVAEDAALPKPAKVIHLLRAAVSGHTVGPSLFPLLTVLGKKTVVARLGRTRSLFDSGKLGEAT